MNKPLILNCLWCLLMAAPAVGQVPLPVKTTGKNVVSTTDDKPLFTHRLLHRPVVSPSPFTHVKAHIPFRQAFAGAANDNASHALAHFWVNVNDDNNSTYNISALNTNNPSALNKLGDVAAAFNGGAALIDNTYYGLNIQQGGWGSYTYVYGEWYAYDTNTWEKTNEETVWDNSFIAFETAESEDGTVYGEFYTSDLQGAEYGIADYKNKTRTTIGAATKAMVAMGISTDDHLYGIATDGNLYEISTTDGKETLVGPTGVTNITDANGSWYAQSGEIDPNSNIFYWSEISSDGTSTLYAVDIDTGHATAIGSMPQNVEFSGMLSAPAAADEDAPSEAEDLKADFPNGALSGQFSFTIPNTTYSGSDLTGDIHYKVLLGSEVIGEGTSTAGKTVTIDVANAPEGEDVFTVILSNDAGDSPQSTLNSYIGQDSPNAPTNLSLNIDNDGNVNFSWKASEGSQHGGWLGNITYNVWQIADGTETEVATGLTDTTYTGKIDLGSYKTYAYAVEAVNGSKVSPRAQSDGQLRGQGFEPPYSEDFGSVDDLDNYYTITDNNNDGETWQYDYWNNSTYCSSDNTSDDWLFTPRIHLYKGRRYVVSYDAYDESNYRQRLEVKLGKGTTADAMTETLMPATDIIRDKGDQSRMNDTITVQEEGWYNIGFHALSEAGNFRLYIDDINVDAIASNDVPGAVTDLQVTPDPQGQLKTTISFRAPQNDKNGSPLDKITRIVVDNGTREVTSLANPTPGAELTVTDEQPQNGDNTYTVTAYNDAGAGDGVTSSVYVGVDRPQAPKNAKAVDQNTSVSVSWDTPAATGANGGLVIPSDVTTDIYSTVDLNGGQFSWDTSNAIAHADGGQNSTKFYFNTNSGNQKVTRWALFHKNAADWSDAAIIALPTGTPAALPWKESFAGGNHNNNFWVYDDFDDTNAFANGWTIDGSNSQDNDGGAAFFNGGQSAFNSFKISLANANNPELIFADYGQPGSKTSYDLYVQDSEGNNTKLFSRDFSSESGNAEWTLHTLPLTQWAGKSWIYLTFNVNAEAGSRLGLDNFNVQNKQSTNLQASIQADSKVIKGQAIHAKATIRNAGDDPVGNYSIVASIDGKAVADTTVEAALAPYAIKDFDFTLPTTSLDKNTEAKVSVKVTAEGDTQSSDAEASTETELTESLAPGVENLSATDGSKSDITLTWDAPEKTTVEHTEDFESYTPFVNPFGDWTVIDGNPDAKAGAFFQEFSWPGQGSNVGFTIMNINQLYEGLASYEGYEWTAGHDGSDQFAMAPYEYDGNSKYVDADNWLISPKLSGEEQTIDFYARNTAVTANGSTSDFPEIFTVLASKSGNAKDDFIESVYPSVNVSGGQWQHYSVNLPEGTNYFAIHQTSKADDRYMFSVDDITYQLGFGPVDHYNIYRDGQLIGTVSANGETTLDDVPGDDNEHNYSVTAVYADGQESLPVDISTSTTGINSVKINSQKPFNIYTIDGKLVEKNATSLNGLPQGIYMANGKKIIKK